MSPLTVLLDREAIAARVAMLARQIQDDTPEGSVVHLVVVLKGAFIFLADLIRAFDAPVTCDFLAVSSYGAGQRSSGEVRLTKDLDHSIEGRDIVIIEDIIDTGHTLSYLQNMLRTRGPRSLRTACLLDKRARREIPVTVEYVGFVIGDSFVVGYGLDANEHYRNLPDIAVVD